MTIAQCPYCTMNTGGQHEVNCPNNPDARYRLCRFKGNTAEVVTTVSIIKKEIADAFSIPAKWLGGKDG